MVVYVLLTCWQIQCDLGCRETQNWKWEVNQGRKFNFNRKWGRSKLNFKAAFHLFMSLYGPLAIVLYHSDRTVKVTNSVIYIS
jgi:hypothetical protein